MRPQLPWRYIFWFLTYSQHQGNEQPLVCKSELGIRPLVLIHTKPNSTLFRHFLRGEAEKFNTQNQVEVMFSIDDRSLKPLEKEIVASESLDYGDILTAGDYGSDLLPNSNAAWNALRYAAACSSKAAEDSIFTSISEQDVFNFRHFDSLVRSHRTGLSVEKFYNFTRDAVLESLIQVTKNMAHVEPGGYDRRSIPFVTTVGEAAKVYSMLSSAFQKQARLSYFQRLLRVKPKTQNLRRTKEFVTAANGIRSFVQLDRYVKSEVTKCNQLLFDKSANETQAIEAYLSLIKTCGDFEGPTSQKGGAGKLPFKIAGTTYRGPRIPKFQWSQSYCKSLGSTAAGFFTRGPAADERRRLRKSIPESSNTRIVFPIGFAAGENSAAEYERILEEQNKHHDLIIGFYYDHYYTLSSKTLMLFEWFENCAKINPDLHWLMKVDADVKPNYRLIDTSLDHIRRNGVVSQIRPHHASQSQTITLLPQNYPFMMGRVFGDYSSAVPKDPRHRNYDDLNISRYPKYCSGGIYMISENFASLILKEIRRPEFSHLYFRNEDAMIGIVMARLNDAKFGDLPIYPFNVDGIYSNGVRFTWGICYKYIYLFSFATTSADCDCTRVFALPDNELERKRQVLDDCDWSSWRPETELSVHLSTYTHPFMKLPRLLVNHYGKNIRFKFLRGRLIAHDDL